jgi:hypothetical protein
VPPVVSRLVEISPPSPPLVVQRFKSYHSSRFKRVVYLTDEGIKWTLRAIAVLDWQALPGFCLYPVGSTEQFPERTPWTCCLLLAGTVEYMVTLGTASATRCHLVAALR